MRPYGQEHLPTKIYEGLDVADIQALGCASHVGKFPGKGGDYRPYSRSKARKSTRRYWKRQARAEGKLQTREGLEA